VVKSIPPLAHWTWLHWPHSVEQHLATAQWRCYSGAVAIDRAHGSWPFGCGPRDSEGPRGRPGGWAPAVRRCNSRPRPRWDLAEAAPSVRIMMASDDRPAGPRRSKERPQAALAAVPVAMVTAAAAAAAVHTAAPAGNGRMRHKRRRAVIDPGRTSIRMASTRPVYRGIC
jgi:hypothetical protein